MRIYAALVPLLLVTTMALPANADDRPPTVSVEGRGEVMASPDTAFITSGVTTQGPTARAALDANSAAMNQLLEMLRASGIAERDIQTSGFSVNPNYVYTDARDDQGYSLPPRVNGYQVYNTVHIRVRDLDSLGAVLDRAVDVGSNTINGISFSVSDPSPLLDRAREAAFADARSKAELYARLAGQELGDLRSVREGSDREPPRPFEAQMAMRDKAESASVPVAGGELAFEVTVQVTWDLDDDD